MRQYRQYYLYILTNRYNEVFYIGMTNDIIRRMFEHKHKLVEGFTQKYNLSKLVYYEIATDVKSAINREKQLKNRHREWKINLITEFNPEWKDLSKEIQGDAETSSA
jgi:putative endonuclease